MTAWKRWQDYATMAFGVLLFISPFVFSETGQTVAASAAYVLGVLLVLAGILTAAMREPRGVELVPAILGVIVFVSPWVLGITAVTGIAWTAWVLGALALINAGYVLLRPTGQRPSLA